MRRKKSRETASVGQGHTSAEQAGVPSTQESDELTPVDARATGVLEERAADSPPVEPVEPVEPSAVVADSVESAAPSEPALTEPAEPAAPVEPAEPTDARELFAHLKQRVLEMPNDVYARQRLADLHDARSEPLLALEQHQAAAAIDAANASVTLRYAQALTDLNRFAEAERELHRVLRLEPDHGGLHLQLGTISYRRGLYSQAEVELKRAIELMPDAATAYFHRGESLNQLSRLDEALDMLERGIALDPNYSRAYYIMGILYDRKSRPQEAGAMYKKAREVSGT